MTNAMPVSYYDARLSAERLRACYDIASPRIQQYLDAEIAFVAWTLRPSDTVLELGCGYGRVMAALASRVRRMAGIDTAGPSLDLARTLVPGAWLGRMDASSLAFRDAAFDAVVCIQNGLGAFTVDPAMVVREALRVTKPGGRVMVSSYSPRFWQARVEWFEAQAAAGLVGRVDRGRTRDGTIVCEDGFRAGTLTAAALAALCRSLGVEGDIREIDDSSLFCTMMRRPSSACG